MERRTFLKESLKVAGTAAVVGAGALSHAQEQIILRMSHFMSPAAPAQTMLFQPWAERVERDSGGRIKCEIYPAMQLGGKAPQLFDQCRTGVADIVWAVPGYTPGRFPKTSVFDLPFVVGRNAEVTAQAIWEFYKKNLIEEFKDIHPILLHCHAPGFLHMKDRLVEKAEDLQGKKIRSPTKAMSDALQLLGASPVGMPLSEAYEALSRGIADGLTLPWEGMGPMRLNELVKFHIVTEMYTVVFLMGMNKKKYESLPPDLKTVIDKNSGDNFIKEIGRAWDAAEIPSLEQAKSRGNRIIKLSMQEKKRWERITRPVIDSWIDTIPNGKNLYNDAIAMISDFQAS